MLQQVKDIHDAQWGISWATLEIVADDLFPERQEVKQAAEQPLPSPGAIADGNDGPESPGPEHGRDQGR